MQRLQRVDVLHQLNALPPDEKQQILEALQRVESNHEDMEGFFHIARLLARHGVFVRYERQIKAPEYDSFESEHDNLTLENPELVQSKP